jgi:hypothetical protein
VSINASPYVPRKAGEIIRAGFEHEHEHEHENLHEHEHDFLTLSQNS